MCQSSNHRRSIFCILPPHVLRKIAQNGTAAQRELALRTLSIDHTFRTLRAIRLAVPVTGTASIMSVTPNSAVPGGKPNRTILDAAKLTDLSSARVKLVRQEGEGKSQDEAVNEAYDGLGDTYDFYWQMLQRNSIDGNGMPLNAYVHYDQDLDNAFWDGQEMVFGDGDGQFFNRFTLSVDVIGHELTHGVTENEAQLIYHGQSGALNESLSDVFGCLIKQYGNNGRTKQSAAEANWLIGEGLFTKNVKGTALRSMKEPGTAFNDPILGKDPQPDHMRNYDPTSEDNGGVHINSGIPNKAFYLVAIGIGGFAGDKAGRIWYETMRDPRLRADANFTEFAGLTYSAAERLYPGGEERQIVKEAWEQVGVSIPS